MKTLADMAVVGLDEAVQQRLQDALLDMVKPDVVSLSFTLLLTQPSSNAPEPSKIRNVFKSMYPMSAIECATADRLTCGVQCRSDQGHFSTGTIA